jgi:hypothetical protein
LNAVMERIRALHAAEASEGRMATGPNDIPFGYDAVTPQWMTHILCAGVQGARVTEISLDEKDEGTAQRQRIFVKYNDIGEAKGLPSSVFCKGTHSVEHRINLGLSGGTHSEVTFYNSVRPTLDIDTPVSFFAAYDPQSFGSIIVLRDIAGEVEFCRHWTPINFEQITSQLDLLVKLHSRFLNNKHANAFTLDMPTWPDFFDAVVSYGHEAATNKGFLAAEEVIPARLYRRFPEIWPATTFVNETHRSLPATLIHGDCHLKQWYIRTSTGRLGVSDWQCASFGHWARDLAYMTAACLTVADRRRWERDLIAYYLDRMAVSGAEVPGFDETWLRYRQNMVQALSWWTGTLAPTKDQPDMQPRDTSLEFIKRLSHAIDDLDALDVCRW